jgi:recombination protein RecA
VKNKCAPPFTLAEFDLLYNEGISYTGDLLDLGTAHGIIQKSGAWLSFDGERIGQGRESARKWLKDNPDMAAKIDAKIRERVLPQMMEASAAPEEEPAAAGV